MTLREKLHALMVAVMQGDKDEAYRIRRELERYLTVYNDGVFTPVVGEFMKTLVEVMEVWGWELEKARRLRAALQLFLDDGAKCLHVDEEGGTEEEVFYKHYFNNSLYL